MSSETQTRDSSCRKYRRSLSSSDEEDKDKSSKHHRHRHRRRRHRHRHRRHGERSRKLEDEDRKCDSEDMDSSLILPTDAAAATLCSSIPNEDVEEGEILEEDGFVLYDDAFKKIKPDFCLEKSANQNLVDDSGDEKSHFRNGEETGLKLCLPKEERNSKNVGSNGCKIAEFPKSLKSNKDAKTSGKDYRKTLGHADSSVSSDSDINGGSHLCIKDGKGRREYSSPTGRSGERRANYDVDVTGTGKNGLWNDRKSLSNDSRGHGSSFVVRSPSCDRYHDESYCRSRSKASGRVWQGSPSQSIMDEDYIPKRRCYERESDYNSYRSGEDHDSDKERMARHSKGRRWEHRDWRTDEREHGLSQNRYRRKGDLYYPADSRKRHRSMERRDKQRERSCGMDIDRDLRSEKEWERSLDKDLDSDWRSEKEHDRSKNTDWRRKKETAKVRDQSRVSERDRYVEMEGDRERERHRDSEGGKDLRWGGESKRDKETHRSRERGRDNYDDKYTNQPPGYRRRTRIGDLTNGHSSKSDLLGGQEDNLNRHDDEEDDNFEEGFSLKAAEQEDEDLNRIEESRRRRQAILEKYKSQQSQREIEPHAAVSPKDNNPPEQSNLSVAPRDIAPEIPDSRVNAASSVEKSSQQDGKTALDNIRSPKGLGEGTPKGDHSENMFSDDIFGESPAGVRKLAKTDGLHVETSGFNDNWDDAEGYYSYRFGEILDGRYEVTAAHGKGVFSMVVRAKDLKAGKSEPEEVAIKIIRNNETMYKAGMDELVILRKLVGADPEDKRHCVRFLSHFKYRNHLCLVSESLHMNLREVLKKFGRNIGLKLTAVQAYAKQLFIALKHLRNCGVLHCDIKPDNILVNKTKNILKLCDFGSAMFAGKNEITPYLVSRFYRAPEIILGLPYDHPLDIWSVGCCLYELSTGKVLFPGHTNDDMLRLQMELKGPFPKKMLRKGAFTDQHFDQDLNFHATEEDPVTRKTIKRMIVNIKPKDFGYLIKGSPGDDPKVLANFKDLLEKIFILDPDKRLTVSQALSHPFITGK